MARIYVLISGKLIPSPKALRNTSTKVTSAYVKPIAFALFMKKTLSSTSAKIISAYLLAAKAHWLQFENILYRYVLIEGIT